MPAPTTWLHALVDYAGLFPPAQLSMRDAVRNYATYAAGPHRNILGRFVVPAARLPEFVREWQQLDSTERAGPWSLSALVNAPNDADWAALRALAETPELHVAAIETKASSADEIAALSQQIPAGRETWIEVAPETPVLATLLAAARAAGCGAKIRTGGVTADAFPSAAQVVTFFRACATAGIPCKATAGLHHALRGNHRLTYESESPQALMHGFVNVFLSAALVAIDKRDDLAVELLEETDPKHFHATPDSIHWRKHRFTVEQLTRARLELCRSFGSCSFTEPIEGLQALHWL